MVTVVVTVPLPLKASTLILWSFMSRMPLTVSARLVSPREVDLVTARVPPLTFTAPR